MDDAQRNARSTCPHPLARAVLSRRRALAAGGGALGAASVLAACGDDADTATTPAADGGSSGGSSGGGAETLTAVADVPVGSAVVVEVASGSSVAVAQPTEGQFVAFSALCTHEGCALSAAEAELDCPCHGSRFDALTGEVLQGPATEALSPVAVQVDGDSVVTAT